MLNAFAPSSCVIAHVYTQAGVEVIPLGLYLIRGDNMYATITTKSYRPHAQA